MCKYEIYNMTLGYIYKDEINRCSLKIKDYEILIQIIPPYISSI